MAIHKYLLTVNLDVYFLIILFTLLNSTFCFVVFEDKVVCVTSLEVAVEDLHGRKKSLSRAKPHRFQ